MAFNPENSHTDAETQTQPTYKFEVNNFPEEDIQTAGPGFIPPHIQRGLKGLKLNVADIKTFEGGPGWVVIDPLEISLAHYDNQNEEMRLWWQGFAYAFMAYHGEPCEADKRGRILIPVENGTLIEIAPTPEEVGEE